MARIRTIKPEFFTSEDIVSLSFASRLLYVALWCEADREGRLVWRPGTFKLRYFPGDSSIEIDACARELIERRLVILYGDGLAHIPKFGHHQHVNPREAASVFPAPPVDNSRVTDASALVSDAHVGREGKEGKEGKGKEGASERVKSLQGGEPAKQLPAPGWWTTEAGIEAAGRQLGINTRPGENYADYKNRIFAHLKGAKAA